MQWNDSVATLILDGAGVPHGHAPCPRPWTTSCAMPDETPVFIKLARHKEAYETERKTLSILNRQGSV